MNIPRLLEILQPYATVDVPVELGEWDDDNQRERTVDIKTVQIILDAEGHLSHVVLGS